jgi:hypothetical protein
VTSVMGTPPDRPAAVIAARGSGPENVRAASLFAPPARPLSSRRASTAGAEREPPAGARHDKWPRGSTRS